MGRNPLDGHRSACILELLDLSSDLREDVSSEFSFRFSYGLDGGLIVCIYGDLSSAAVSFCVFMSDLQR